MTPKFKENIEAYSEEQGEYFHREMLGFKLSNQESFNEHTMGGYIWWLIGESSLQSKRKSQKSIHF